MSSSVKRAKRRKYKTHSSNATLEKSDVSCSSKLKKNQDLKQIMDFAIESAQKQNKDNQNLQKTVMLQKKENEALLKKLSTKKIKYRSSNKKNWSNFHLWTHHITKEILFRRVKFITNSRDLDAYETKGTIGYAYLQEFIGAHGDGNFYDNSKREEIWKQAKDIVHRAIGQKRNSVQLQLGNKFKGIRENLSYLNLNVY